MDEQETQAFLQLHNQQEPQKQTGEAGSVPEDIPGPAPEPVPEPAPEPDPAPEIPSEKPRRKFRSHRWLRRALYTLCGLAVICAVAAGSCLLTAHWVQADYARQMELLNRNTEEKLAAFRQELQADPVPDILPPAGKAYTPEQIFRVSAPAVVSVVNLQMAEGALQPVGTGTGFFISADGFLVTNYHVIDHAQKLTVICQDGSELPVQIVGADAANDLAVLKAQVQNTPYLLMGSSDDLQVGDQVAAIGNALGQLHATITVGYVSAKDRIVTTEGTSIPMLQTDAAINSGNSGGPLFNMRGQVVGITTAKVSGFSASGASIEGIGYAIPIDDVLRQIRDLQKFGYLTGPYMGVVVQEMNPEVVRDYGLPLGLQVKQINPGSAGEKSGLHTGDILLNLGGYDVVTVTDLMRALRHFEPGESATMTVFRQGKTVRLVIVFDPKPRADTPPVAPSEGDFDQWYRYFRDYFGLS